MNRLHKYLPSYYEKSKTFNEITKVEDVEFNKIYNNIEDLNKQFLVDTATWGLAIYEKELGLPVKPNRPLERRRSIVRAKMRGIGKVDNLMIKAIVEAFTGSLVTIEFDGRIVIVFNNDDKIDLSSQDLYHSLDEVKPAHLDYNLENRIVRNAKIMSEYRNGDNYIPPCNTIVAGTWWYLQNEGRLKSSSVKLKTDIKEVELHYPETALYVVGEDGHIRHDFASQFSIEQIILIENSLKSNEFNFQETDSLLSGTFPDTMKAIKLLRRKLASKPKVTKSGISYNLCGTKKTKEGFNG